MKYIIAILFALSLFISSAKADPDPQRIAVLELSTTIDEKIATALGNAIEKINDEHLASSIVLEINSYGGSVDDGLELAKKIERSKLPITCIVDGEAHSMASYILESCPKRVMTKRSLVMIHEPITPASRAGQPTNWLNNLDYSMAVTHAMMEHYALHMKIPPQEILQRIQGGRAWFMNWEDALKYHVVDSVVDSFQDIFPKN